MDLQGVGVGFVVVDLQDLEDGVHAGALDLAVAEEEHGDHRAEVGVGLAARQLAAVDPGPVVEGALTEGGVLSGLHLDVDVGAVGEAHEDVEDGALLVRQVLGELGVQDLDLGDRRVRPEHRGEEGDQDVAVLGAGEEDLEDDVEGGVERAAHDGRGR